MASLIEELIGTLEQEDVIYKELIPISQAKTQRIVANDLLALQDITATEQEILDRINALEHKREEVIRNVGIVIGKDPNTLTVKDIVGVLNKQPDEQTRLSLVHDSLKSTIEVLIEINNHNKSLIKESLELIEFNMNLMQSTRMSPGNNYTKGAAQLDVPVSSTGMFDAKQ